MNYTFEAIGTHWEIQLPDNVAVSEQLRSDILDIIERYDQTYSRFRTDSRVWSLSHDGGVLSLDDEGVKLFSLYRQLYELTEGQVTPLIGNTLSDAGYDKEYSFIPKQLTNPPFWNEVISLEDSSLILKKPVLLDTGAVGKGHIIDIVSHYIEQQGIQEYTVDAGGDIRQSGLSPLRIGLEDPKNPKQVLGVVDLQNNSICGSAGNRRAWGEFHHILSPKTLKPVDDVLAVWVLAPTTMLADGLSTCLFFVDPQKLLSHFSFYYAILYPDYSMNYSKNFPGEIF